MAESVASFLGVCAQRRRPELRYLRVRVDGLNARGGSGRGMGPEPVLETGTPAPSFPFTLLLNEQ